MAAMLNRDKLSYFDNAAMEIVVVYCVMALAWAVFSESFLSHGSQTLIFLNRIVFVLITGILMAALLLRHRRRIRQYAGELRESNMRAEVYFESGAQAILVVAPDGKILRANAKIEQMFGYEGGELEGRLVEILVPERLRAAHLAHREGYLRAPRSRPMGIGVDLAGQRKDGGEFPLEISLNYIAPESGGPLVVCFITDISERLAFERQTRRAETVNTLGAIAAGIAHDLNNPLAIISSRAELMLSLVEGAEPAYPEMREDLEVIRRNAQRASVISTGLLSLAAQRAAERKPVNINELLDATLLLVAGELHRKNIEVKTSLDRSLPAVQGDPTALQRVIMNLLLNARDAMPDGGRIRIETGPAPDRAETLQLSIADTGVGIPAETLPKLFGMFFTTKESGTGLGLWLAYRTLREHRGQIAVESEPGKGAKFILTLPVMGSRGQLARSTEALAARQSKPPGEREGKDGT